jgi:hypothetical protein
LESNTKNIPIDISTSDNNSDVTIKVIEKPVMWALVIDNNLRIRDEPNVESSILGILNFGSIVEIIEQSEQEYIIGNMSNYWYKIKTIGEIIGWIFGGYITMLVSDDIEEIKKFVPEEFRDRRWMEYKGNIGTSENITLEKLQNSSWHKFFSFLQFSKEKHYAIGDPWSGSYFGYYHLENNCIYLFPPITVNRFDEYFNISKLYYSNEMYYEGTPVLRNDDESVVFYPNPENLVKAELGDTVKRDGYECIKIFEKTKINSNNILYALPDRNSKNLFYDNYYGNQAILAFVARIAKANIKGEIWYYTFMDFTDDEPTDGGGPYYYGWLPQDMFE